MGLIDTRSKKNSKISVDVESGPEERRGLVASASKLLAVANNRDAIWSRPNYEAIRDHLGGTPLERPIGTARTAELLSTAGSAPRDGWLATASTLAAGILEESPWAFACAVRALEQDARTEAVPLAEGILAEHDIGWRRSKLACLRGDLYRASARSLDREGCHWLAAWHALVAFSLDPTVAVEDATLDRAVEAVRRQQSERASIPWRRFPWSGSSTPEEDVAALRTTGQLLAARNVLESRVAEGRPVSAALRWEHALVCSALRGDVELLRAFADAHSDEVTPAQTELMQLFALALPERSARKQLGVPVGEGPSALALAYAAEDPVEARVLRLGDLLERAMTWDGERAVLAFGAVARFLHAARQHAAARLVLRAHRTMNLCLSGGLSEDIMQTNVESSALLVGRSTLDFGGRGRQRKAATLVAELAAKIGFRRLRSLFRTGARAKRLKDEERNILARTLADHALAAKGPLYKLVQHLGYLGLEFDDETQRRLDTFYDSGPGMAWDDVEPILHAAFGGRHGEIFESIEPEPLGVGSMGQVHGARLREGREVVVKVQYPGIEDAVRRDIWSLGLAAPLLRMLVPRTDWRALLRELEDELLREADYREEAATQERYRRAFEGQSGLRIPAVLPQLATRRVLVMERARGVRFSEFARTGTAHERTAATRTLYDFFLRDVGCDAFYADFNPGNFLFEGSDVWCLDFGCVKHWSRTEHALVREFASACIVRDRRKFRALARKMDVTSDPAHFDYDRLASLFDPESCRRHDADGVPLPWSPIDAGRFITNFSKLQSDQTLQPYHLYGVRAFFSFVAMVVRLGAADDGMSYARDVIGAREASSISG